MMESRGAIRQRRLASLTTDAVAHRVTMLRGPAGFGKTHLATQVAERLRATGREVRWITATASAGGAQSAASEVAESLKYDHSVVLDDVHCLDGSVIDDAVAALERSDGACRLVLSGRWVPSPRLSRLLVRDDVFSITPADLALDPAEVEELIGELGPGVREGVLSAFVHWPALATAAISGDAELILAYLHEEVLATMPDDQVRLIAAIASTGDASPGAVTTVAAALDVGAGAPRDVATLACGDLGVFLDPVWVAATAVRLPGGDLVQAHRHLARLDLQTGNLASAGRHAIAADDPEILTSVCDEALATVPPPVPVAALETWLAADLLDEPHQWFLEACIEGLRAPASNYVRDLLRSAQAGFAAIGDPVREGDVMLVAGQDARSRDDLDEIVRLLARVEELAAGGDRRMTALRQMGRALQAQMSGDPLSALIELDHAPDHVLTGDWRSQFDMMRGTNLMLLGRVDESISLLRRTTGSGSPPTRAIAHELLAMARWLSGDREEAHRDLDRAGQLMSATPNTNLSVRIHAFRDSLRLLDGRRTSDRDERTFPGSLGEAADFDTLARALALIGEGADQRAREFLESAKPVAPRAARAAVFLAALEVGLGTDQASRWAAASKKHRALVQPVAAGRAAAAWRAGGPVPDESHRRFLPAAWLADSQPVVRIEVLGHVEVRRNGETVEHPRWARDRVRELCLHLALVPHASRLTRAEALWTDLSSERAAANLRVTLSQLLEVLEPNHRTGHSELLDARGPMLEFRTSSLVQVDIWDLRSETQTILGSGPGGDEASLLAATRLLLELTGNGTRIGIDTPNGWSDDHQRQLDAALLRSLAVTGPVALKSGDYELARRIGARALEVNPWGETSAQLVARALIAADDLDGARRSLIELSDRLREIDVSPQPETRQLFAQLGISRRAG